MTKKKNDPAREMALQFISECSGQKIKDFSEIPEAGKTASNKKKKGKKK